MSTEMMRIGRRAPALASLCVLLFASSCDFANDEGGPGGGPGVSGSLPATPPPSTTLQSIRASVGEFLEPNGHAFFCSMSADGRFVAYTSGANNLITGDTNGQQDIFVLDRDFDGGTPDAVFDQPGTIRVTRVSLSSTDAQSNGFSDTPSISADGRFVAFSSGANNLSPDDTNGFTQDVFVRDRGANFNGNYLDADGDTIMISRSSGGAAGNSSSNNPSISGNGLRVAFESFANNLVAGDTNGTSDVFVREGATTTRVSVEAPANIFFPNGPDGAADGNNASGFSQLPAISTDGNVVVFISFAADIIYGDGNGQGDAFMRNIGAAPVAGIPPGATAIISVSSAEVQQNNQTLRAVPNQDGTFVAFDSGATNLDPADGDFRFDVYVRNVAAGTTTLVSVNDAGVKSNSDSAFPVLSADGNTVFFTSAATNLDPAATNFRFQAYVRDISGGDTILLSVDNSGNAGNGDSAVFFQNGNTMSADGSASAFSSSSTNMATGDVNGLFDIYLRNRDVAGDGLDGADVLTYRVSERPGNEPSNACLENAIAGNGQYAAFSSFADNLLTLPGGFTDGNSDSDVLIRDVANNTTRLVSISTSGTFPTTGSGSFRPAVSANGRFVAFDSNATDLITSDLNGGVRDVFVRDLASGEMFVASQNDAGTQANLASQNASISSLGAIVAFETASNNLVDSDNDGLFDNDNNGNVDIFVRDLLTNRTTRVSIEATGVTESDGNSSNAAVSGNGRFVAFQSIATNLTGTATSGSQIFRKDLQTGAVALVSASSGGAQGDSVSDFPSISSDGRFVVFESLATNLVSPATSGSQVFMKDLQTGAMTLVSASAGGAAGDGASISPSISADGRFAVFRSLSTNLVTPGTTGAQIFRKNLQNGAVDLVSASPAGAQGNNASSVPTISDDGQFVSFDTSSTNLTIGDTTPVLDVYVRGPLP